jgi:hypothetical protein
MKILEDFIGKTELQAIHLCVDNGFTYRVESEDGEKFILTADFRTDRVNVQIEKGIIVKSRIG